MTILRIACLTALIGFFLVACDKRPEPTPAPSEPAQPQAQPPAAKATAPTHVAVQAAERAQAPEGMVSVPGGSFDMGLPKEITQGEGPKRTSVGPFFLDRTEVTVAAYQACVSAGKCSLPPHQPGCNATAKQPLADHPMNCVTKDQAEQYCSAQGKRLPTEAEWEFAARGTDGRVYPWGNEDAADQLCWQGREGARSKRTCPAGSYPQGASPFGALDMAGNVAEWTSTPDTERDLSDVFMIRGGSYRLDGALERAEKWNYDIRADRHQTAGVGDTLPTLGFRCARNAA
jgi:formylglycine-generating enzyme